MELVKIALDVNVKKKFLKHSDLRNIQYIRKKIKEMREEVKDAVHIWLKQSQWHDNDDDTDETS